MSKKANITNAIKASIETDTANQQSHVGSEHDIISKNTGAMTPQIAVKTVKMIFFNAFFFSIVFTSFLAYLTANFTTSQIKAMLPTMLITAITSVLLIFLSKSIIKHTWALRKKKKKIYS